LVRVRGAAQGIDVSADGVVDGLERRRRYVQVRLPVAVLLAALAVTLLLVDIALLARNRSLQALARAYYLFSGPPIGKTMSALSGTDPAGKRVVVRYGADPRKTLLFVFSPDCHVCDFNWPAWQRLIKAVRAGPTRMVFVNLSPELTSFYICDHAIGKYLVVARLDPASVLQYNLRLTPETVLLGSTGKIEHSWVGALDPREVQNIRSSLEVSHNSISGGEP
jgi:hypothetical protein